MKKVLSFIFVLLMIFAPICGIAHALGGPEDKIRSSRVMAACDSLYQKIINVVSEDEDEDEVEWSFASDKMTDEVRAEFDSRGIDYLVWKIRFSDSRFDRTVLCLAQMEPGNTRKTYVCDFLAACDNYCMTRLISRIPGTMHDCTYEFLFTEYFKYRDFILVDFKEKFGASVVASEFFKKNGERVEFFNKKGERVR